MQNKNFWKEKQKLIFFLHLSILPSNYWTVQAERVPMEASIHFRGIVSKETKFGNDAMINSTFSLLFEVNDCDGEIMNKSHTP